MRSRFESLHAMPELETQWCGQYQESFDSVKKKKIPDTSNLKKEGF